MRVLDLFCGAGGASMGYHRAWPDADIVGVDIVPMPRYPFTFVQADALAPPVDLDAFDFIHASPPCQEYSVTRHSHDVSYPMLVEPVREMLQGHVHVIENVVGAPIANQPTLDGRNGTQACGSMFGLKHIRRHRWFETSFPVSHGWCNHQTQDVLNMYRSKSKAAFQDRHGEPAGTVYRRDSGLEWMTLNEALESFPPVYTQWIGEQLGQA